MKRNNTLAVVVLGVGTLSSSSGAVWVARDLPLNEEQTSNLIDSDTTATGDQGHIWTLDLDTQVAFLTFFMSAEPQSSVDPILVVNLPNGGRRVSADDSGGNCNEFIRLSGDEAIDGQYEIHTVSPRGRTGSYEIIATTVDTLVPLVLLTECQH